MAVWIKICGMTDAEAVSAALEAGVDAIGFVFAASPRRVTPAQAVMLAMPARGRVRCVAVTKHPSLELVATILSEFAPDILQTDVEDLATLGAGVRCETLPVLRNGQPLPAPLPSRLLFEGATSGTGQVADWSAASLLAKRCELILAGGLSSANVAAAISMVRPCGIDVSSGVEEAPGRKSPQRIFDFVRAARAATAENNG